MAETEVLRAFRFALDATAAQEEGFLRHAGAARWAFNHALGMKVAAHRQWQREVKVLVDGGMPEARARKTVKVPVPTRPTIRKHLNRIKGDSRSPDLPEGAHGPQRPCPWFHEVSTYAFQSAFEDADRAWGNWQASLSGRRAGRKVGYPRFKKKGRTKDSFRICHDAKKPTIRPDGYRRLRIPALGSVRLHDTAKPLAHLMDRGASVKSVTVSRSGTRWYASVLVSVHQDLPERPTHRQRQAGTVGVDFGVKTLATLTAPITLPHLGTLTMVPNPRHLASDKRRLTKAQRALSRTTKGSARRRKAAQRVGNIHHHIAERRATYLHTLTKQLATSYAVVAVESLNVVGMTSSARGTVEKPGSRVRQKSGLNRSVLDASPAEMRRQLDYKTRWNGSQLAVCDRWFPSSRTCSACGWQKPSLTLAERVFTCGQCGLVIDRDLNAARNIAAHAVLVPHGTAAPGRGEASNARGAAARPATPRGGRQAALKREDTGPPRPVPPQRSDPLTLFTLDVPDQQTAKRP